MKTVLFACRMLEEEVTAVLRESKTAAEIEWFEKGLHNSPDRLRGELQRRIDALPDDVDRILLTFGYCGGCLVGLHSRATIVIPRVDDCITLLLGSFSRRLTFSNHGSGTYFLTNAWMDSDHSIASEYDYAIRRYGETAGRQIFNLMFHNYSVVTLLDTGLSPLEDARRKSEEIADALGLDFKIVPATLDYLRELVHGPWPKERYVVLSPGRSLTASEACTIMNEGRNL